MRVANRLWSSGADSRENANEPFARVLKCSVLPLEEHDNISGAGLLLSRTATVFAQTIARSVLEASRQRRPDPPAAPLRKSSQHLSSNSSHSSQQSLLNPLPNIVRRRLPFPIPQVLHLVRRHQASFHATAQVSLAQLAALGRVDSTGGFEAAEVLLHERLAFGVVVEREGAFGGRVGAADFDAGTRGAESGHLGGWVVGEMEGFVVVVVDICCVEFFDVGSI